MCTSFYWLALNKTSNTLLWEGRVGLNASNIWNPPTIVTRGSENTFYGWETMNILSWSQSMIVNNLGFRLDFNSPIVICMTAELLVAWSTAPGVVFWLIVKWAYEIAIHSWTVWRLVKIVSTNGRYCKISISKCEENSEISG